MTAQGLKPHTHAERGEIIRQLIPLFERRFGARLVAIAAGASYARGDDQPYSDLELTVFLTELPPAGEDRYLRRIFDGMLVEAEYTTREEFLGAHRTPSRMWFLAGSAAYLPVFNEPFVEQVVSELRAFRPAREQLVGRAGEHFHEVQEAFSKTLNAVGRGDAESVGLLLYDAVVHSLITLSFLNEKPFTTFATFIKEARAFTHKPARFDELLDLIAAGTYRDLARVRAVLLSVFEGFEELFAAEGVALYDETLDPAVPNRRHGAPPD